ncbi:MAG TPA: tetratricopeptide repeat protein [Pyrinomonadaceae bacterium]|jgi:Flp pilus assembly protein TadD|nr:tetratricopeptide repeat protein [Pyrinomonadaceae bacterium]
MAKKKRSKQAAHTAEVLGKIKPEEGSFGLRDFFSDRVNVYIMLALAAGCFLIYGQTYGFNFISIDDSGYVYENAVVTRGLSWDAIKWAFTTYSQANWHPLTWLSYLTDTTFFGPKPGAYHLVNVLFHTANSILLFIILKALTGSTKRSAIVAALFAFHPTHVESVAWIAERKDVLSTLFWFLTTYFYIKYVRAGNDETQDSEGALKQRRIFYIQMVAAMVLGLLAKPMLVTLPFTLLLLDYWPLGRLEKFSVTNIWPLIKEKIPLFLLSAASSVITVIAQKAGGAVVPLEQLPFYARLVNSVIAYAKYAGMMFYPANLGVIYPFERELSVPMLAVSILVIALVSIYSILEIKRKKYLFVGWFWFIGTLVPVIGLVQVGLQSLADRYTYIPFIGLSIAVVWLAAELLKSLDKRILAAAACAVIILFGWLAFKQAARWKDSESLYLHTIAVTKNNGFIEQNLCLHYTNQNRLEEAEVQCKNAAEHNPTYYSSYKLLGVINFKRGNFTEAAMQFMQAIQLKPDDSGTFSDLAKALLLQGKLDEAAQMTEAMASASSDPPPIMKEILYQNYDSLGLSYSSKSEFEKAALYFGKALEIKEDNTDVRSNLGFMLYRAGKKDEGIAQIEESIKRDPAKPELYNMLGTVLADQGKKDEAVKQFEKALELKPDYAPAKNNLVKVQGRK